MTQDKLSPETKATLLRLADFAPTIPDEEWDLEVWWCGTHGCLIGNAINKGLIPELTLAPEAAAGGFWDVPTFGAETNFKAIATVLGIGIALTMNLFSPEKDIPTGDYDEYPVCRFPTKEEMADNIRDFVAAHS